MKKLLLLAVMTCALALAAGPASAMSLSLNPPAQQIGLGGIASVDLMAGSLGEFGEDPSVSAFDVTIEYDPFVLSFLDVVWGLLLGDPALFEADVIATPGVGSVNLSEVSFLSPLPVQLSPFTLAVLRFTGINIGSSDLTLQQPNVADSLGNPLTVSALSNASVSVASASVPEPATLLLLGTGLVGLAGLRRKFKRA